MTSRLLLLPLLGLALPAAPVGPRALALHRSALVFDAHVHMIERAYYGGADIGVQSEQGQVDLPRLREGGVDALFFTLFVREEYYPGRNETRQVLRLADFALRELDRHRDKIAVAHDADELEAITRSGRIAAVLDLEGGFDLDGDPAVLAALYRLGFRSMQLSAHNWSNEFADSCCSPARWHGLTERGRQIIREMNRLGMVINVSHASDETLSQAIDESTRPLVATHHGLRHFNDLPRTMSDELLKKLAAKGGVIGFHLGNEFHNRKLYDYRTQKAGGKPFWDTSTVAKRVAGMSIDDITRHLREKPSENLTSVNAPDELLLTPEGWIEVVEYAVKLVGEDHVALGSDFDGGPTLPRGMRDVRDLPRLTEAMLRRGWPPTRIRKFLGGNMLRVFRQITRH